MVKPPMPCRISAGLLARGTLSRASFQPILNNVPNALVFFNGTTDDEGVCFVWHRIASLQHAASLLACRCIPNPRDEVSEDEPHPLLFRKAFELDKYPSSKTIKCSSKLRSLMVWSHLSFSTALCKLVVSTELFRSKPQVHSFLPRREDKKRFRMSSCGFSASELSSIVLFIEVQPLFSPKPLPNFPSLCYTTPVHQHQKGQRRVEVL